MKIYCELCNRLQPAIVDVCRNIKTGEMFQDIVCGECRLVIASGVDIKQEWVDLTDEELVFAYMNVSDKEWAIGGMQDATKFAHAIAAKLKEKNT